MINISEISFFTIFLVFIFTILIIDLGVFSKKSHIIGFKEALIWSIIWIGLSIGFYFFIIYFGNYIHGIDNLADLQLKIEKYGHPIDITGLAYPEALKLYEQNLALEYLSGYFIEKSLSVDNIFVMIMIFYAFGVEEKYYKRVLTWGILGAVVMRFIFIFAGAALVIRFNWILYLFGLFLIYTGIHMFFTRNKREEIEPKNHPVVKFASRYFRTHDSFEGQKFFIKKNGKWFITPLLIVLLVIEFSDVIFAVDSIPAIFSITKDPFIIFFSNIFAILGLRALFFLVENVINRFYYLKIGLAFLLTFIGVKMLIAEYLIGIGFTTIHSFYLIVAILLVSILASILFPPKEKLKA